MNSIRYTTMPDYRERIAISTAVDHGRFARVVYRNARRRHGLDRYSARTLTIGALVQCGAIHTEAAHR